MTIDNISDVDNQDPLPVSGRVVKAEDFSDWQRAKDIVSAAESQAEEILSASNDAYEQAKRRGYEEGLKAAKEDCFQQIINTAEGCIDYVQNCESAISQLAVTAIEKIIGSCDHERVTGHLIRQGLERMSAGDELRVRVPKGRLSEYQKLIDKQSDSHNRIRLVECESLDRSECLLESSVGVIRLSLKDQVEELKKSVQSVLP